VGRHASPQLRRARTSRPRHADLDASRAIHAARIAAAAHQRGGLADLEYHARLLRALGLDATHRIVIHLGGAYGDREAALGRMRANLERLSDDARTRLVFENDERWTLEETLAFARSVGPPVVFDVFHHELNPSFAGVSTRDLVLLVRETWNGPQEVHFSTQEPGKRPGAHSATLDAKAFVRYAEEIGDLDVDCILEVKDKEQSVLRAQALAATPASV
jgi:UV DNA damage endonuclease